MLECPFPPSASADAGRGHSSCKETHVSGAARLGRTLISSLLPSQQLVSDALLVTVHLLLKLDSAQGWLHLVSSFPPQLRPGHPHLPRHQAVQRGLWKFSHLVPFQAAQPLRSPRSFPGVIFGSSAALGSGPRAWWCPVSPAQQYREAWASVNALHSSTGT